MLRRPVGERQVNTPDKYSCSNKKFLVVWMEAENGASESQEFEFTASQDSFLT